MIDTFVWLTPILMLPLVAILAFVGCDLVIGVDRLEPKVPVLTATLEMTGNLRVDLSWPIDRNATNFQVTRGETSGALTLLAEVSEPGGSYSDTAFTPGKTYIYAVEATGGEEGKRYLSNEASATIPFAFVTGKTLGTPRNAFTTLLGVAIRVGSSPLTIKALGRAFAPGNMRTHSVKIVNGTGVDVPNAFVEVSMTDPIPGEMPGDFRYTPFPEPGITLNAGADYFIVSQELTGQDNWYDNNTTILTTSVATATNSIFFNGAIYNRDGPAGRAYGPVDFLY